MSRKLILATFFVAAIAFMATLSVHAQQAPPAGAGGGGRGGAPAGAGGAGQGGGAARGGGAGGRGGGAAQATVMLKPGLSMVTGAGANSLVRVTNDGIVVVNTKNLSPMIYDAFMEQIKMISDKPVKYAVVGDVHQDKSGNTESFVKAGVQVIGHVNEKKGLETYTNAAGTPTSTPAAMIPTPVLRNSQRTCVAWAPSAILTAISCVRRFTAYAIAE